MLHFVDRISFLWQLSKVAIYHVFPDLGTNGLGWFVTIGVPLTVGLIQIIRTRNDDKHWLERLKSNIGPEIRLTVGLYVFVAFVVFLCELLLIQPSAIRELSASATIPSIEVVHFKPKEEQARYAPRSASLSADPIKVKGTEIQREFTLLPGSEIKLVVKLEPITKAVALTRHSMAAVYPYDSKSDAHQNEIEENLWKQLLAHDSAVLPAQIPANHEDVQFSIALSGLAVDPLGSLNSGDSHVYFLARLVDAKGKSVLDFCAHIDMNNNLSYCHYHNGSL